MKNWEKTLFLKETKKELKGWLLDVMNCIDKIGKNVFSLKEVYQFEEYLFQRHPENFHIKDKIRQQLKYLRDYGYLKFIGNGEYNLK